MLARLRERALEGPFPPGTGLSECDLDPERLIRSWDHTEPTVILHAVHTRPSHPGRIHRLAPGARRPARSGRSARADSVNPSRRRGELNRLPGHLVAYAVETADTSLGSGFSPSVAVAAVDILVTTRIEDENVRHRIAAA